jgi:hypothetical protein
MLKSYSNTRPIMKNGKCIGNKKRQFPDGFIDIDQPCFTICSREIKLYLVIK